MTTIGLIGSGRIGSQVARLAIANGYDVVLSNSRGPGTLQELVHELGPKARAGTAQDAAESGDIVEFATVGPEGMVGFPVLLGADSVPSRAIMQIPGAGMRMKAGDFRRALERTPTLQDLLLRSTMALLNQVAQSTSCNRLHEVQERCARWLLQTHDR